MGRIGGERLRARISQDWIRAEVWRGVRFLAVGALGLAADTAIFMALHAMGAERALARAVSLGAATLLTWALNRGVTFARTGRLPAGEFGRYGLVALVAQGFNYGLFLWLSALFPQAYPPRLIFVCAVAAAGCSYLGQRLFTFAPKRVAQSGDAA